MFYFLHFEFSNLFPPWGGWRGALFIFFFFPPWGGQRGVAQQIPLYSQYYLNPFIYNPAYTGMDEMASAYLIHRIQWNNMNGGPRTTALTLDAPVKKYRSGIGFSLLNDKTGYTERFGIYGSYAHKVSFSENTHLQLGLSFGAMDNRVDISKAKISDTYDPTLAFRNTNETTVDGNFGMAFIYKNVDFGVAVPQMFNNKIKYQSDLSRLYYQLSRHYLGSLKYTFHFGKNNNMYFAPLVLMRYVPGAPMQYDINGIFNWKETAGLAISYKSKYAWGITTRLQLNNRFNIGYCYEYITSGIAGYSGASHEIALGYYFDVSGKGATAELQKVIDSLLLKIREKETEQNTLFDNAIKRADSLFNAGKFQEALAAYKYALSLKPSDRYAKEKLDALEKKYGTEYRNAIAMGDAFMASKDYRRAKEMFLKALEMNPNDEYAKKKLQELEKLIGENDLYKQLMRSADSLFMAGKLDAAKAKYEHAQKFNPEDTYLKDIIEQINKKLAGGVMENIRMYDGADFTDIDGNPVEKGFYIVVSSFANINNARRFMGNKNAGTVYSKVRKFYYCYLSRHDTYEDAKAVLKTARKEAPDSWLFILR